MKELIDRKGKEHSKSIETPLDKDIQEADRCQRADVHSELEEVALLFLRVRVTWGLLGLLLAEGVVVRRRSLADRGILGLLRPLSLLVQIALLDKIPDTLAQVGHHSGTRLWRRSSLGPPQGGLFADSD